MFGPFETNLDPAERLARLRALRAFASVFCHGSPQFIELLRQAETDSAALEQAHVELDRLPALNRRKLLASYAELGAP